MRKTFLYKGFYLSTCKTRDWKTPWVGTIYHKKFDKYIWWTNHHYYNKVITYEFGEEPLIARMKDEVDKFLEKFRKYLEFQVEDTKVKLDSLLSDLDSLP